MCWSLPLGGGSEYIADGTGGQKYLTLKSKKHVLSLAQEDEAGAV